MPKYTYKAKKGPQEILEGIIEADSEGAAVNKLTQDGFYLISLREVSLVSNKYLSMPMGNTHIKQKDVALFTKQLADLLGSGLALYNALDVLSRQEANPQFKFVMESLKGSIKDGNTFSESLKKYPKIFSNLYVNIVKSGEAGSSIHEVLLNIADFLDKEENIRSKIIAALVYPMMIAIVGMITIFILVTFVVPKLVNMFLDMGQSLPFATKLLIGISSFMRAYWFILAAIIIGVLIIFQKSSKTPAVRAKIDKLKLKMPILGSLIKDIELARFSRTLSMLLKNGVPILYSLEITASVITNTVVKKEADDIYQDIKAGSSLTASIIKNTTFPAFVSNMTAVGEEGGFLDRTLLSIATTYESEIDRVVKIITTLLEPAFILVMGLVIGFIVVAMLLPVFQISLVAR